ncbi:hypothetical protein ACK6D9_01390 [Hoeflea sp. Naph1]|uniref:hypothetical protein n=1 Tax=Hoeflea sp. Naph1 TaxID=3388653 RepID=UPI00399021EE
MATVSVKVDASCRILNLDEIKDHLNSRYVLMTFIGANGGGKSDEFVRGDSQPIKKKIGCIKNGSNGANDVRIRDFFARHGGGHIVIRT